MMDEPMQSIVESRLFLEKTCFNLYNIPIARAELLSTIVLCSKNSSLLLKITPKYLVISSTLTSVPAHLIVSSKCSILRNFGEMIIAKDLARFIVSLLFTTPIMKFIKNLVYFGAEKRDDKNSFVKKTKARIKVSI